MVVAIVDHLIALMRPHLWLLAERYNLPLARKSLALHERMLAAIEARDVITALSQVKLHYAPYPVTTLTSSAGRRTEGGADAESIAEGPSKSRSRGTRTKGSE
jgi:hypothetical protein